MRFLLDTHAVLWTAIDSRRLSDRARSLLGASGHDFFVSAVSSFEIATKYRLGKLPEAATLLDGFEKQMEEAAFHLLSITSTHGRAAGSFPQTHKDPFDRLLAAQAKLENLTLLSADTQLDSFGIDRTW